MSDRSTRTGALLLVAGLLAYPLVCNDFWLVQIGGRTLGFGTIVLSLVFLSTYCGMLSLAQMTVGGLAAYAVAYCTAPTAAAGVLLPWPVAVAIALSLAIAVGLLIGLVAVRTEGIYTLMLTLAIAMGIYYLALQNYAVFNGFTGFTAVPPPSSVTPGTHPFAFYYGCLGVAALAFGIVTYLVRTPFGLALQATRDNPRRVRALGYPVQALRIAGFGLAGFLAGLGGILNLWLNGSVSPGSIGLSPVTNVLIAAVLGGIGHPLGAYVGAFVFTVVNNFAVETIVRDRFNSLIGLVFLLVVLFSPDGLAGAWSRLSLFARLLARKGGTATGPVAPASSTGAGPAPTRNMTGETP
jgi:branched-chain amino acid transport system permease protein